MSILYNRIIELCNENNITGYRLCKDVKISPNVITELRMGRKNGVSAETANKIAKYFGVTVGYILGEEDKKTPDLKNEIGNDLDNELVEMLVRLNAVEIGQVRAYIQGLLASHKD